jgi:hypothetical protein
MLAVAVVFTVNVLGQDRKAEPAVIAEEGFFHPPSDPPGAFAHVSLNARERGNTYTMPTLLFQS